MAERAGLASKLAAAFAAVGWSGLRPDHPVLVHYDCPVTLRLHDTATRDVRDFVPLEAGKAGIYVCGLTVQSEPHVGHVRSAVNFDVLRRWLMATATT